MLKPHTLSSACLQRSAPHLVAARAVSRCSRFSAPTAPPPPLCVFGLFRLTLAFVSSPRLLLLSGIAGWLVVSAGVDVVPSPTELLCSVPDMMLVSCVLKNDTGRSDRTRWEWFEFLAVEARHATGRDKDMRFICFVFCRENGGTCDFFFFCVRGVVKHCAAATLDFGW